MQKSVIEKNLKEVYENIHKLSWEGSAKLVAVTKMQDVETTNILAELGQFDIGENRVQVLREKMPNLDKNFKIHFIGRLQTNKIRYIIRDVFLYHSLDRLNLIEALNDQAIKDGLEINGLLQVNIAREPQKAGFSLEELQEVLPKLKDYRAIHVNGLMAMMPFIDDELELAKLFKAMRKLYDQIKLDSPQSVNMNILSMGMSGDYKIALSEGSNMIRIGTALFRS
ncbi:YggS family pyridoxal phosphate-dependent enzyme [Anaerococcus sp.]|uniref:YggS family pyridoxal phosphate-dependent enzyme n=1 Tax=Anaerococcus sp. TaxID=1872515 RepID=UPI002A9145A4|nr:YggS family pyridoxal phosphate-dependent enzyme [Anaerococcus sp.]MDY6127518.1 YggS family pyridoxal phosphate-dependent enzyme [Anaerococcus sp.]